MGLISGLLMLPLAPVRGTVWVAEQVLREAEDQYYDPARIRRQMEDIEEAREAGEISEEEAGAWEDELVRRLMVGRSRPTSREGWS